MRSNAVRHCEFDTGVLRDLLPDVCANTGLRLVAFREDRILTYVGTIRWT